MYVYMYSLNPPTASLQVRWVRDSPAQTGSGVKGLLRGLALGAVPDLVLLLLLDNSSS